MTKDNTIPARRLMSRIEAADYLGVCPQTLAVWATTGRYRLPYVRVGTRAMYRQADLDAFVESRLVNQAGEATAAH